MTSLWYLIPFSIIVGGAALLVFFWTLRSGQYEDLDGAAERILYADDAPASDTAVTASKPKHTDQNEKSI